MLKRSVILVIVLTLLAAVCFQLFGNASQREDLVAPELGMLLPAGIPGWEVEDKPVADSPEMLEKVEKILSYDSAVFRVYRKGGVEISIYAAYWLPGKVPVDSVDAHTPDVCWVANGWQMEVQPALAPQPGPTGPVAVPNVRSFTVSGQRLSVVYWHVNGSELRAQSSIWERHMTFIQRAKRRIKQFENIILNPPGQQLFVRISTNGALESALHEPPAQACLELLNNTLNGTTHYIEN